MTVKMFFNSLIKEDIKMGLTEHRNITSLSVFWDYPVRATLSSDDHRQIPTEKAVVFIDLQALQPGRCF